MLNSWLLSSCVNCNKVFYLCNWHLFSKPNYCDLLPFVNRIKKRRLNLISVRTSHFNINFSIMVNVVYFLRGSGHIEINYVVAFKTHISSNISPLILITNLLIPTLTGVIRGFLFYSQILRQSLYIKIQINSLQLTNE